MLFRGIIFTINSLTSNQRKKNRLLLAIGFFESL